MAEDFEYSRYDLNQDQMIDITERAQILGQYNTETNIQFDAFQELWEQDYEFDQMTQVWSNYYSRHLSPPKEGGIGRINEDVVQEYYKRQGLTGATLSGAADWFLNTVRSGTPSERAAAMENPTMKKAMDEITRELHPDWYVDDVGGLSGFISNVGDVVSSVGDIAEGVISVGEGIVHLDTGEIGEGFQEAYRGVSDVVGETGELIFQTAGDITSATGNVIGGQLDIFGLEAAGESVEDLTGTSATALRTLGELTQAALVDTSDPGSLFNDPFNVLGDIAGVDEGGIAGQLLDVTTGLLGGGGPGGGEGADGFGFAGDLDFESFYGKQKTYGRRETVYSAPDVDWTDQLNVDVAGTGIIQTKSAFETGTKPDIDYIRQLIQG